MNRILPLKNRKKTSNNIFNPQIVDTIANQILTSSLRSATVFRRQSYPAAFLESKLGGIPFLPESCDYPRNAYNGAPMRLLAQINFSQIRAASPFPSKGLLQFYITDDKHLGMNLDNPSEQTTFKIIYHKSVDNSLKSFRPSSFPQYEEHFLSFNHRKDSISVHDCEFNEAVKSAAASVYPENSVFEFEGLKKLINERISSLISYPGCKIGGYPSTTTSDFRLSKKAYLEYNILLLQIDDDLSASSNLTNKKAFFFIKLQDLLRLDFSNVIYVNSTLNML